MKSGHKELLKSIGKKSGEMADELNELLDEGQKKLEGDWDNVKKYQDYLLYVSESIEFMVTSKRAVVSKALSYLITKTPTIKANRAAFLNELRTGNHKKGTIKSDEKGRPVIESESDNDGACACAIMGMMFGQTESGQISLARAAKALGIDGKQCGYIQRNINDTPLTFPEIADRIEREIFNQ